MYLLGTRVASGETVRPCGTVNGKLALMNGYGATSANLAVGALNSEKAEEIADDNVFLTVENLKGFMRVSSGSDVSASDAATAAVETSGESGEVTLVTRKPNGSSGFFKVIRNGK